MLAGVISTVSTDALLLKHQVISTQSADYEFIQWASFIKKNIALRANNNYEVLFWFDEKTVV